MKRGLLVAVLLCLAGAGLLLLTTSRTWVSYGSVAAPPLPPRRIAWTGHALAPGARALGFVGLAGVAALVATRGWSRLLVGALLVLAGGGAVAVLVRALGDPDAAVARAGPPIDGHVSGGAGLGGWPYAGVLGGLLVLAAGALAVARGRTWSALGSRYDAPAAKPVTAGSLWDALDRGEDPTGGGTGAAD